MNREIKVKYSEDIVRSSVRKQWLDLIGTSGFAVLGVLIVLCLFLLISGDRGWFFGFGSAALVIFGGVVIFGYFRMLNAAMAKLRQMESPTAIFHFGDEGISVSADTGKTEFAWKMVKKVLRTSDVWIIMLDGGGITLPTCDIDNELQRFILEKASRVQ